MPRDPGIPNKHRHQNPKDSNNLLSDTLEFSTAARSQGNDMQHTEHEAHGTILKGKTEKECTVFELCKGRTV